MTVLSPAIPGTIPLMPPLNPAKKCGSIKPVTMRTSASTKWRLTRAGVPSRIVRVLDSRDDSGAFVLKAGNMRRFDDRGVVVGQIDRQVSLAISEIDIHTATQSNRTF